MRRKVFAATVEPEGPVPFVPDAPGVYVVRWTEGGRCFVPSAPRGSRYYREPKPHEWVLRRTPDGKEA